MSAAETASGWDRRRQLLLTEYEQFGLDLFAERGYSVVTFDDIAEAAGVSVRTLYRYFPTKEEILLAFPRRGLTIALDTIASLPPSADPLRTAWTRLRETFWDIDADVAQMNLWRRAVTDAPEVAARIRGERLEAMLDALSAYVARCLRVDPLRDVRPRLYAGVLAGVDVALVELWGRSAFTTRQEIYTKAEQAILALRRQP